jgi:hypothetical protein
MRPGYFTFRDRATNNDPSVRDEAANSDPPSLVNWTPVSGSVLSLLALFLPRS